MNFAATNYSHFIMAAQYYQQDQLNLAQNKALEELKYHPGHFDSVKLLGLIDYRMSNWVSALGYLQKAAKLKSDDLEVKNLMGCIFIEQKKYQQSLRTFENIIHIDSKFINAYLNIANTYLHLQKYDMSIEAYREIIRIEPANLNIIQAIANLLFKKGDYQQSIDEYSKCLDIQAEYIPAYSGLFRCYFINKQQEKIDGLYKQAKALTNKGHNQRLDMTNVFFEYGDYANAIKYYKLLLLDSNDNNKAAVYNNLASSYDHIHEVDNALEYFNRVIKEYPDYLPAYSNIGRVFADVNQLDNATKYLKIALKAEPNNSNANVNMGRIALIKKHYTEAIKYFKNAIESTPTNTTALYNLGNCYHEMGNHVVSSQYYQQCLDINPNYVEAEQNLSLNELALGQFDRAWGHYFKRIHNLEYDKSLSPITPGMNLNNKKIYFCRSQGIGDELFFLRFLPILKRQNIFVSYRPGIKTYVLLNNNQWIDHLLKPDEQTPASDEYFTIDDLPLILNADSAKNIPPALPLNIERKEIEYIKNVLKNYPHPHIAITWRAGSQEKITNHRDKTSKLNKCVSIDELMKSINHLGGTLIIIQRNPEETEIKMIKSNTTQPVLDLSNLNDHLSRMLALLSLIDEYIGVSNTNTHLSAACGKAAHVLVPYPGEWRWMAAGDITPWFPEFKLYRQKNNMSWKQAMKNLNRQLSSTYNSKKHEH